MFKEQIAQTALFRQELDVKDVSQHAPVFSLACLKGVSVARWLHISCHCQERGRARQELYMAPLS